VGRIIYRRFRLLQVTILQVATVISLALRIRAAIQSGGRRGSQRAPRGALSPSLSNSNGEFLPAPAARSHPAAASNNLRRFVNRLAVIRAFHGTALIISRDFKRRCVRSVDRGATATAERERERERSFYE